MSGIIEWIIFGVLAIIAVVTAAGMLVTMSMYRAGLALMASFVALAGIFILLDADLLAMIQIMMNVGGMLIMMLFMVMLMMDPGGQMMWDMKRSMHMRGLGAFSMAMPRGKPPTSPGEHAQGASIAHTAQIYTCPMHPEVQQDQPGKCPKCGMALVPQQEPAGDSVMDVRQHESGAMSADEQGAMGGDTGMAHGAMPMANDAGMADMQHAGMDMGGMNAQHMNAQQQYQMLVSMAMSTAQLPWALIIGAATAVALILLVVLTPWHLAGAAPSGDAAAIVGNLLLGRYMVGFEGAAFLIVAGIAGAVILARREGPPPSHPQPPPASPPQAQHAQPVETKQIYTCPMHPEVQQDHPGTCPKCGMDLVPQTRADHPQRMDEMGHDAIDAIEMNETDTHGKHSGHADDAPHEQSGR
jgi:NADH-quinone oxidoreductase subunit J